MPTRTEMIHVAVWAAAFTARVREYRGSPSSDGILNARIAKDAADVADDVLKVFEELPSDRWPFDR